ncbi:MAG: ATP-binding protein [Salinivirgaceae bacterium]|jgi:predicted AAA+ superfamily ATPase|nr:ATP-binding protein [Salinivirgaceae bacterium]
MDKVILKKIIIENREFIQNLELTARHQNTDIATNYIFCGIRRCGKSFMQFQRMKQIMEQSSEVEFIYINFEDERFIEFNYLEFDLILECAFELYKKKPVLFFDEIQNIENWEKFARRLADTGYLVYITGSNAKMLSKEMATTLGGRYLIEEVYPLSFIEYLIFKSIKPEINFEYSNQRFEIKRQFKTYLHQGGFPELLKYQNSREYLSSVYMKVFYGDLMARNHLQNEQILKLLIKKLAESVNNETSINRIKNLIISTGLKVGNNTITDYLIHLFDSYLIFPLNNYASNFTERETKKKYYFVDQGILNLFITDQNTKLLENIVFMHLYTQYKDKLFYYKRKMEIDFYIPEQKQLIQVCYSLSNIETKQREIAALQWAMNELNINKATIITYDEAETITLSDALLTIELVPIWKWLLTT